MDYIYGKLNQKVEKQTYKGKATDTTTTFVDNINNTISVDINDKYTKDIDEKIVTLKEAISLLEQEQKKIIGNVEDLDDNVDKLNKSFYSLSVDVSELKKYVIDMESKYDQKFVNIGNQLAKMKPVVDKDDELIIFDYEFIPI